MVQLPQGVPGWTVFFTGLLIVAYRVHGIDSPREWIEWLERRFTDKRMMQFVGAAMLLVAGVLVHYGTFSSTAVGGLFVLSLFLLGLLGLSLLLTVNHVRMLVLATAEADDKYIRISSIVITFLGLLWALTPWF